VVFKHRYSAGASAVLQHLSEAGFLKNGGRLSCVYYDEEHAHIISRGIEGLAQLPWIILRRLVPEDPISATFRRFTKGSFPARFLVLPLECRDRDVSRLKHLGIGGQERASSIATRLPRPDHGGKSLKGPGGPAEMVFRDSVTTAR